MVRADIGSSSGIFYVEFVFLTPSSLLKLCRTSAGASPTKLQERADTGRASAERSDALSPK